MFNNYFFEINELDVRAHCSHFVYNHYNKRYIQLDATMGKT